LKPAAPSTPHSPSAASRPPGAGRDASETDAEKRPASPPHAEYPSDPFGSDDACEPLPHNPYKGNRGVMRAWYALKYSFNGFRVAIREESAFRQELTLAAILLPIGLFVPVEPIAHALLVGSILLVLIVELLNSSVEAAIDRISLERHELSKRAKDLGSAAVTVALANCVCTWGFILAPPVWHWAMR
jgi:diacylglycerol kinase (ATP)